MRFLAAALLFFLLFQSLALAANESSAVAANASESPPGAPDVQNVIFLKAVFSNGSIVQAYPVVLLARSNKSDTIYRTITDSAGKIILPLNSGNYELDALLDLPSTPGIDFASTTSLSVPSEGNATMFFYPSGSLAGYVQSEEGLPVAGARVRVSCPSSAFDYGRINGAVTVVAGEAGDFLFRALPVGTCLVSSSTDSLAGTMDVQVLAGQVASVSVGVKKKAPEPMAGLTVLLLSALAILIAMAIVLYLLGRRKNAASAPKPPPEYKKAENPTHAKESKAGDAQFGFDPGSPRAKAVLATLSAREREIVKFLFRSGGRAKRSQMQHKLLIPKTSLLRNLRSLERKNIVKLTPFGRNLLAELEESLFR